MLLIRDFPIAVSRSDLPELSISRLLYVGPVLAISPAAVQVEHGRPRAFWISGYFFPQTCTIKWCTIIEVHIIRHTSNLGAQH